METEARQEDYFECWQGLKKNFDTQALESFLQPQLK
jgi:hypothetical protein